jgi:hypothetical protein
VVAVQFTLLPLPQSFTEGEIKSSMLTQKKKKKKKMDKLALRFEILTAVSIMTGA